MSALEQNCAYVFGKRIPDAKENVMTKERMEEIRKSAAKYMPKETNEAEKRKDER